MIELKEIFPFVFASNCDDARFSIEELQFISTKAKESPFGRARICFHKNHDSLVHEMLIAMTYDSYVHPHKHKNKTESFLIIDGSGALIIFNDEGDIKKVIKLSNNKQKTSNIYYKIPPGDYHMMISQTPLLIFQETTNGPFDRSNSELSTFSTLNDNKSSYSNYMESLRDKIFNN
jgi:cupin fold WbuC family metalloprotein